MVMLSDISFLTKREVLNIFTQQPAQKLQVQLIQMETFNEISGEEKLFTTD